jgi:hypothetical protein
MEISRLLIVLAIYLGMSLDGCYCTLVEQNALLTAWLSSLSLLHPKPFR